MESSGGMRCGSGDRRHAAVWLGVAVMLIVCVVWAFGPPRSGDEDADGPRPVSSKAATQAAGDGGGAADAALKTIAPSEPEERPIPQATDGSEDRAAETECGYTGLYRESECDWTMADNPPWCREIDCGPQPNGLIGTRPGDASDDCIVIIRERQPIAVDASCNPEHIVYPRVIRTEPTWILLHKDGGTNCRCEPLDVTVTRTGLLSHSRETRDQAPTGIGGQPVGSPLGEVEISEPSNVEWVTERVETFTVTESTTISPCRTWSYKKYKERVGIYRDVREVNTLYACSANGCYWVALVCPTEPVMTDESEWLPEDGHYPVDAGFGQYPNCPGGRSCSDGEDGACDTP